MLATTDNLTVPSVLASYSPEQLRQIAENLDPTERSEVEEIIADWNCQQDALKWAQSFTFTENPKWKEQSLNFRDRFPQKDYFRPLFQAFKSYKRLFIPKTREMLTSWCAMVWATSQAQWEKAFVIVQADSEDKAKELVGYGECLYRNQEQWLKERHPLAGEASQLGIEWKAGGRVLGLPKGEHKIRVHHPTVYIIDEAAFLPEAEQCYNAAHPVAGQIIAISSAGPGWFGGECSR